MVLDRERGREMSQVLKLFFEIRQRKRTLSKLFVNKKLIQKIYPSTRSKQIIPKYCTHLSRRILLLLNVPLAITKILEKIVSAYFSSDKP